MSATKQERDWARDFARGNSRGWAKFIAKRRRSTSTPAAPNARWRNIRKQASNVAWMLFLLALATYHWWPKGERLVWEVVYGHSTEPAESPRPIGPMLNPSEEFPLGTIVHPLPAFSCVAGNDSVGRCLPAGDIGGFGVWRPQKARSHAGVDLYVPEGTPMHASHNGTVEWANHEVNPSAGRYVQILADDGRTVTRYLHLNTVGVVSGQRVRAGEVIGTSGRTAIHHVGAHLHFEIARHPVGDKEIDSNLIYLDPTPSLRSALLP